MKLPRMIGRLASIMKARVPDPWNPYGFVYTGRFAPEHDQVGGYVEEQYDSIGYHPPTVIIVVRDGQTIGSTREFEPHAKGWWYKAKLTSRLEPCDVLQERVTVIAIDHQGNRSPLRAEGAAQMAFIQDCLTGAGPKTGGGPY